MSETKYVMYVIKYVICVIYMKRVGHETCYIKYNFIRYILVHIYNIQNVYVIQNECRI